ncbi:MAG: bifunctional diaminohydroxyphosphoribosylaminopyrimidine deaminase/5-amino-6-(5-phosphoribosylamino)uracil reductase RibD [Kiritimatiellaeota bacterium]|nr:bifunctional diaminohydroxyphosphoribosylaminopyrimidine deaminase/5-amino-6-(5-phosphoribosylamino)uracil reductase RibD [Kiritimatiellota bacterium]
MKIENSNENWMNAALGLADKGYGMTSPNPMVGSVVVSDGKSVGEGFHAGAGLPHAEVEALRSAGSKANGATLHVNLEPCSTTGRTPPCVDSIISAGVAEVVIGCLDPNPRHAGKGVDILRKAGVDVKVGILEKECERLNEAFFHWITTGRPFVMLKLAATLDGKIATASGNSQWITGEKARGKVQELRRWADAIMIGGETARRDRPSLTVRDVRGWRQPKRLVASRSLTVSAAAELLKPGEPPIVVSAETQGDWIEVLRELGKDEITALLVEGGGILGASLLAAGVVDKLAYFIAPKILGGRNSRSAVSGLDPKFLDDAIELKDVEIEKVGNDILVTGYPNK